jgi:hypothetical protein
MVLSPDDLQSFVELGYCTVRGAFSARQAAQACQCLWNRMEEKAGIREAEPSTWPAAYDVEEHLDRPEIEACFTDRLAAAVQELVGSDRWLGRRRWGLWPVNFSFGADRPYEVPISGWHVDGNWFRHAIDCPKQGLLIIGLFTDIAPRWGGTLLALGSHKRTARVLANHPEGMDHEDLFTEALSEPLGNFYEVTGSAGDVVLAHPFLFHNKGMKHGGPPRIISNTEASLRYPMRLDRTDSAEHSVLEHSIRRALQQWPAQPGPDARQCYWRVR